MGLGWHEGHPPRMVSDKLKSRRGRAPPQGDVGHLADDLGVNISRGQQHFSCAGDAVGNVVVFWVTLVWETESSLPFLNHFREMFLGEKQWDVQVKLTVCSGVALTVGPDTMGGRAWLREEHL